MGPIGSFADLRSMLMRHATVVAAVLSAGIIATLFHATSIPTAYQAGSVIQIQSGPISAGADQLAPARRLQLIEQRMMSRSNVLKLVERHGLFADQPRMTDDQKVFIFRQNTDIQMINSAGRTPSDGEVSPITALIITARADTSDQAAAIANDLASSLIVQDREERFAANTAALQFLRGEQERLSRQLAAVDEQMGTVKKENEESLPEVGEAMRSEQASLRELLLDLERRDLELEREQLVLELGSEEAEGAAANLSLAERLRKLSSELAQTRRILPNDHPEVRRIEAEIQALRSGRDTEHLTGSDRQIALVGQQRDAVTRQMGEIMDRQQEIERALEAAPSVAQRLTTLGRRQALLADQLASVTLQLSQTESQRQLQENAEVTGMEVLEAAEPPRYPLSSGRKRVAVLGAAASFGAALAAAFLLEMRRPVMRTAAQVQRALGIAPIASVVTLGSSRQRQRKALNYLFAVLILAAAALTATNLVQNRQQDGVLAGQPQP